ncbi:hypothetical protein JDV02_004084 [Purpureocillium takamizusanense]|uniref:Fungal lipase-type domain-containing protein n=1 Tax=Purpureocillium takamizusanense TaxID=2060973 RepID=A0A9Q8VAD8_9HYPO|nr:uncharacterized protein JDV02_004084 [Purpureocillium takamizusanense]UNI17764.1 hypothetical protein JDV02_004084 [Purpureocillium takamizusanense]
MDFLFGRKTGGKGRRPASLKRPSLSDPPNVYYSAAPPPPALPNRPATSTGSTIALYSHMPGESPYTNPVAAYTQQQFPPWSANGYDPSSWAGSAPAPAPAHYQWPVGESQEYYNNTAAYPGPPQEAHHGSVQNLSAHPHQHPGTWATSMVHLPVPSSSGPPTSQQNDMGSRFDDLMTLIDREGYAGDETDLFLLQQPQPSPGNPDSGTSDRPRSSRRTSPHGHAQRPNSRRGGERRLDTSDVAATVLSGTYFSKVDLYANSRLPLDLPPFAVYMPTWPLLCLAARHSQRVYSKPRGPDRLTHIPADWLSGTKAMTVSSVPADHAGAVVLAIRGSASFADWAVNLRVDPAPLAGFLDDDDDDCGGNACHAGFLSAARSMVRPVARRLRRLLDEDPCRAAYSLILTGHSAGGAVAALLYMHMIARSASAQSDLTALASTFKRVHCVTFGAPPVALLPLRKPDRADLRKSLFLSFVNEGDPVARADKEYVKSLLELLARPPPPGFAAPQRGAQQRGSSEWPGSRRHAKAASSAAAAPLWPVPPVTLCNAGRLVVLRSGSPRSPPTDRKTVKERLAEGVVAAKCTPEQLGRVIWGDPVCHLMSLYAARIEVLAVGAVTAKRR